MSIGVYIYAYTYLYICKNVEIYIRQSSGRPGFNPRARHTLKMLFDTFSFNSQQCKVHIKDKVEQSWERSSALPFASV